MNSVIERVEWPIVKIGLPGSRLVIISIATWHGEFSCHFSVELMIDEPLAMTAFTLPRGRLDGINSRQSMDFEEST